MGIVAGTRLVFEGLGGGRGTYVYKGSVDTYDDLVAISDAWTDAEKARNNGYVYNVRDTGKNYAWNGTSWDDIGGEFVEGAGITITSSSESNTIAITGADSATSGQFPISDGNDSLTWRQPVVSDLSDVTATANELNQLHESNVVTADLTKLHNVTADATELNYVDGVTSPIQTQLNTLDQKIDTETDRAEGVEELIVSLEDISFPE